VASGEGFEGDFDAEAFVVLDVFELFLGVVAVLVGVAELARGAGCVGVLADCPEGLDT
jgi:hypothetical protein